jgi:class 3 adenylate cyclase
MTATSVAPREYTVLFADLVGSTQLYERVGDNVAFELVDGCLKELRKVVEHRRGTVIKHTGDGLMAVFGDADRAAEAAVAMHLKLRETPAHEQRLAVRIGFHFGPVIVSRSDVFGETVNFASRLAELAAPGRALTTAETWRRLSDEWKRQLHQAAPRVLRGASRPLDLFELRCESMGDITVLQDAGATGEADHELKLFLDEQTLVLNAAKPIARLGRDPSADLRVSDKRASRQHAQIELRGDKFVLIDRSTNGTFVAIEGEKEFLLSREEAVIRGQGHIALGSSCRGNPTAISFVCI